MLNDATCFKAVSLSADTQNCVPGWTGWKHWWKHRRETDLMYLTLFTFSAGGAAIVSKDWYGKGMDGSCYIRVCQKAGSNGRAAWKRYVPPAIPLTDGRADAHSSGTPLEPRVKRGLNTWVHITRFIFDIL